MSNLLHSVSVSHSTAPASASGPGLLRLCARHRGKLVRSVTVHAIDCLDPIRQIPAATVDYARSWSGSWSTQKHTTSYKVFLYAVLRSSWSSEPSPKHPTTSAESRTVTAHIRHAGPGVNASNSKRTGAELVPPWASPTNESNRG